MKNELLAHYRKKAGLTQQQVGEHIGISAQAVSKWENGQSEPDIETLCKLATLYHVSLNTLIGAEENINAEQKSENKNEGFFKKHQKAIIISAVAAFAVAVAAVILIIILAGDKNPPSESSRIDKFSDIELGMTMTQIKNLMGTPTATDDSHMESDDPDSIDYQFEEAGMILQYGLVNCDFWYYNGEEYLQNFEADKNMDLTWEFLPYYQIRIAFDADGSVIEAYYDPEHDYTSYDYEEKKTTTAIELTDGAFDPDADTCDVLITFSDSGMYLGTVEISGNEPIFCLTHPWGETYLNENGEMYTNKLMELSPEMTVDEVKTLFGEPKYEDDSYLDVDALNWEKNQMLAQYGIVDCDFLYYAENDDFEYVNIRIAFDKEGALAEAYYDAVATYPTFVLEDGEEKNVVFVKFCDGDFDKTKKEVNVIMVFDDGCTYFGCATVTKRNVYFSTYYTLTTSYGSVTLDSDGMIYNSEY